MLKKRIFISCSGLLRGFDLCRRLMGVQQFLYWYVDITRSGGITISYSVPLVLQLIEQGLEVSKCEGIIECSPLKPDLFRFAFPA
jgi:hypothetical protein